MTSSGMRAQDGSFFTSPQAMLDLAWQRLARGVADRRAAARTPALATVGTDGGAEARTVVLRSVDRQAGHLRLHTDAASRKTAELSAEPRATLLIWDAKVSLQIRAKGVLSVAGPEETRAAWRAVPSQARSVYGATPPPGQIISCPEDQHHGSGEDRFRVLVLEVDTLDLLHLGTDRHRRALFVRGDGFDGQWITP